MKHTEETPKTTSRVAPVLRNAPAVADVVASIQTCPELPEHIKAALLALLSTVKQGGEA